MAHKTHIIAMTNAKGGVGKTTSTMNIGALLAMSGLRTLLVDADAQASLTHSMLAETPRKTINNVLHGDFEGAIVNIRKNLDIIPASTDMTTLENELAGLDEREFCMTEAFDRMGIKESYDVVIIDCPPNLGNMTTNALVCATDVYVPMLAQYLSADGFVTLNEKVARLSRRSNPGLEITGIFVTMFDARVNNVKALDEELRKQFGDTVFKTRIHYNSKVADSPSVHQDIYTYAPNSAGAQGYVELTKEILTRLGYKIS